MFRGVCRVGLSLRACQVRWGSLAVSHVKGSTADPLWEDSIGSYFMQQADKYGDRTMIVACGAEGGERKTWHSFAADCKRVAVGLKRLGYQPGDRLGVWLPNHYEWLVTQFACHLADVILVNVNPAYRPAELTHAMNLVGCRGLVVTPRHSKSDYAALLKQVLPELESLGSDQELHAQAIPSLRHVLCLGTGGDAIPGSTPFQRMLEASADAQDFRAIDRLTAEVRPEDAANIQFTSGTTGLPKAATLTHRGILNNGRFIGDRLKYTEADKVCIPVPLYHCFGTVLGTMACVTHGSSIVLPGPSFDPRATLQAVADNRCTSLYGVPTMFIQELGLDDFGEFDLSSLRTGIMAGSPCPPEVMAKVQNDMGMTEVTICYGMTETSPVSFQSETDTPTQLRCDTVGSIHPHVECKVVGEDGEVLPVGVKGELCTKGYSVMKGYWNDDEATAKSIDSDGFMHTGDLATIDADGYCRIVGRKGDMIIRGGENVYPTEIENYIHTDPRVQDVAVVGAPHPSLGEQVVAFVVPAEPITEADVKQFCGEQIAHYKVPSKVYIVDSFPLTVTGKVQKFLLRKKAVELVSAA